ncbi:alpha-amylase family glycosyl hydrolase [Priestia taiwanensis]|uniref:Alpha-amylase n=1 Tax=Priestia taiwanensis TaxID=1347902 RepID=A0A917AUW0_9BACI|nr:alpha-amylase family glycosyl hydrolase [Priestia taiwanensis]MBM7364196.1 glycosidase [Priestia taiwanensis]GGE72427.1 alpha-amylase [Priestia taiwanensis]
MKKIGLFSLLLVLLCSAVATAEERTWQDESIYVVTVDRFNNGDNTNDTDVNFNNPEGYYGGDFVGIAKRLEYMKEMGHTAIRLSPILQSEDYAGEKVTDYTKLNKHFGTEEDLKALVSDIHKQDMKIVVELMVMPALEAEAIAAGKWLVSEFGIDAIQLKKSSAVTSEFVSRFTEEVKSVNKDAAVFNFQAEESIDGFMDDAYYNELVKALVKPDQSLKSLYEASENADGLHYMDNADTRRFVNRVLEGNENLAIRLKMALMYMYTTPGIPSVYYGTEIALNGGETPDNRKLMDFKPDKKFLEYISRIGQMRQKLPVLRHGDIEFLYEKDGMLVFKRTYKDEVAVVAINNTTSTQKVQLTNDQLPEGKQLFGAFEEDIVRGSDDGYEVILDRETSNVFLVREKTGLNYGFIAGVLAVPIFFFFLFWYMKKRGERREKQ